MDHRPSCRNPWLPLLLLVSVVLVLLSCALHATADCSTEIGTNEAQTDSGNGGDCHGRNHTHSHGHHGGSSGGKDKPGTTPAAASNSNNPWVLTAGAAPRPQVVSGFTAATGVIVLVTGAAVSWSLTTY
ncbi:uncharacterized protein [Miscanthus floridulus]|uniref:uncharacterized protein n=1 Tax=Miscanthus floridulus TaxID=154761 RepID=UPI003457B3B7